MRIASLGALGSESSHEMGLNSATSPCAMARHIGECLRKQDASDLRLMPETDEQKVTRSLHCYLFLASRLLICSGVAISGLRILPGVNRSNIFPPYFACRMPLRLQRRLPRTQLIHAACTRYFSLALLARFRPSGSRLSSLHFRVCGLDCSSSSRVLAMCQRYLVVRFSERVDHRHFSVASIHNSYPAAHART